MRTISKCPYKKVRRLQVPTDSRSAKPFAEDLNVWENLLKNLQNPTVWCRLINHGEPKGLHHCATIRERSAVCRTRCARQPQRTWSRTKLDNSFENFQKKTAAGETEAACCSKTHTVVGIGERDTVIKSCKPLKQLFVYGVHSVCDADALKDFMDKQGVRPKQATYIVFQKQHGCVHHFESQSRKRTSKKYAKPNSGPAVSGAGNCRPSECVCEDHRRLIEQYYSDVMSAMITASKECIPSRSKKSSWVVYVCHKFAVHAGRSTVQPCARPVEAFSDRVMARLRLLQPSLS
ncbi:hypothetical protein CAPTEDRAFT_209007 [Capitella teleta]|uniref:Uncharacterized protein n=1 Tax=Capitella teleta TaxID=283909 RepID=R7V7C5_CAPTE|nr:hypothetical protein CAPTEDRAFT_209007 [Capitella teleta]|eukprot:ELU11660.1 hypothetical protein CAPTEDRAFT_209007 [Capitella teleta]